MKTTKNSFERLGIKTGLVTSLLLVCYFSLMKLLGLAHIVELRFFNFVIMAAFFFEICLWLCQKAFPKTP